MGGVVVVGGRKTKCITYADMALLAEEETIPRDMLLTPVPNYTDVDISFSYANFKASLDFMKMNTISPYIYLQEAVPYVSQLMDKQLSSPPIQEFIRSNNSKFDLVFLEALVHQSYYGLIHHVGSPPVIGIKSTHNLLLANSALANPVNPSYCPDLLMPFSSHMTFYERLQNTLFWIWMRYYLHVVVIPQQEAIMRKHFGPSPPPVEEADRNMSLIMLTTNWMFGYPFPQVPALITVHSLHVKTQPDPLPQDLQQFLDEATEGVIYFSLGTNARSDRLPQELIRVFLDAFSQLPVKVLWKWESDILPGQPSNVRTRKWLPQQDILAHHNVILFITQCGLQSFQEAVYHGVPLLAIPIFGDQIYNAKKIEDAGIGIRLSFSELTKDILLKAINEILSDSRYKNNMKTMSAISKDDQQTSIDKAVWWTEYVLRHNGAKHLRSAAIDLTWYQYFLLDILAFFIFIIIVLIFAVYICFRTISRYVKQSNFEMKSKSD
ncbi:hypothetical protein ANN_21884 [Periplaneta americana]|uniref:UDP-glucuronosyltransferase n=1 Tax=Periplaneta americana TaxID=6978 RepID=A0ABQ8S6W7_PERAM|nr:hypothetical protein ANN_21884 [Periplaneta americana]